MAFRFVLQMIIHRLRLSGHRNTITDMKVRIRKLKHHHTVRIEEMQQLFTNGAMNAFPVVSKMMWDIEADSYHGFCHNMRRVIAEFEVLGLTNERVI